MRVKKFIYAASSSCYGSPKKFQPRNWRIDTKHPYAFTKFLGEEAVIKYADFLKCQIFLVDFLMFMVQD